MSLCVPSVYKALPLGCGRIYCGYRLTASDWVMVSLKRLIKGRTDCGSESQSPKMRFKITPLPFARRSNRGPWVIAHSRPKNARFIRILTSKIHNKKYAMVELYSSPAKHLLRGQPCDVKMIFAFWIHRNYEPGFVQPNKIFPTQRRGRTIFLVW